MSTPIINVSVTGNDIPSQQYKTIILKPNLVDDVNTLTQAMLDIHGANTKFVIKYDFTLGEDITVPANCVLEFDGGSISGAYTLTGNNTGIQAGLVKIFNTDVTFDGTWKAVEIPIEWFGGISDYNITLGTGTDNSPYLESAMAFAYKSYDMPVCFYGSMYYFATPINVLGTLNLKGKHFINRDFDHGTSIRNNSNSAIFVASGITLFTVYGRAGSASNSGCAPMSLKNLNFAGTYNNRTSTLIDFRAHDYPSRISVIEECEIAGFATVLDIDASLASNWSCMALLCIDKCMFYICDKVVYNHTSSTYGNASLCNTSITNCTFEYCTNSIRLEAYGSTVIKNILFETQYNTAIEIYMNPNATVDISDCNFSDTGSSLSYDAIIVKSAYSGHNEHFGNTLSLRNINVPESLSIQLEGVHITEYSINVASATIKSCIIEPYILGLIKVEWIPNYCFVNTKYINPVEDPSDISHETDTTDSDGKYKGTIRTTNYSSYVLSRLGYSLDKLNYGVFYKAYGRLRYAFCNWSGAGSNNDVNTYAPGIIIGKIGNEFTDTNTILLKARTMTSNNIFISQCSIFLNVNKDSKLSELGAAYVGSQSFNGTKPTFWSGTAWVDATGATV